MSLHPRTIASNTSFYTVALTAQKLISFVYFSYLARSLGADLTGKYFFALSIAGIVMAVLDVGMTPVLTREAAKDEASAGEFLNHVFSAKLLFSVLTLVGAFFIVPIALPEVLMQQLLFLALIIAILDSFSLTFFGAIRARQNLFFESLAAIVFQLIILVFGSIAIWQGMDIRVIMAALFFASLFNAIFSFMTLRKKFGLRVTFQFNKDFVRRLAILALPFALAAAFVKVNAYIDSVLLRILLNDAAVGIYSVAYKITFALQFIPLALVAALYPAFSFYHASDPEALGKVFSKSIEYLLIIILPISLGVIAVAEEAVPFIYTSTYSSSVVPLMILISSLPFLFINFPIGTLLNASNRQVRQMVHQGITMCVNILLNLLLIPKFGPVGAALASLVSTVVIFFLGAWALRSFLSDVMRLSLYRLGKVIAISVMMFCIAFVLRLYAGFGVAMIAGALFYAGALYVFNVVGRNELHSFLSLVKR